MVTYSDIEDLGGDDIALGPQFEVKTCDWFPFHIFHHPSGYSFHPKSVTVFYLKLKVWS